MEDTDSDTYISSVLIKVREGYDIDRVITNIRRKTDGVQIVRTQNLITGISKSLAIL
ncbi:ABC transporter permease protein [Acetivibrio straminisolvens JCM 21531]|uniref:ABC transporter permease protein n=1 Tax=Acetivibrio straminisolvens JCM 21531 TaxID=1294263 RepID=W4V388_9FIRM|nr:ABC transporter permease protein [Acetivibrio straminisolvens JCM 21531]